MIKLVTVAMYKLTKKKDICSGGKQRATRARENSAGQKITERGDKV